MKVINLTDLKIDTLKGAHSGISIEIGCPDFDKPLLETDAAISQAISSTFKQYVDKMALQEPIMFTIAVNGCAKKMSKEDIIEIVNLILASFNHQFVETERRDREYRFGLTYLPQFTQLHDTPLHIMRMVNYRTKVDKFNLNINFYTEKKHKPKLIYHYNLVE